jgi:hypothetical protein
MKKIDNTNMWSDLSLYFKTKAIETFEFLKKYGFTTSKTSPTSIGYRKNDIEIGIDYDRQESYEISADITISGEKYPIGAIVGAVDTQTKKQFHYVSARTRETICMGLEQIRSLIEPCLSKILQKDSEFLSMLEEQQKQWTKNFALNVLASQLRPKAEDAFRHQDYLTAIGLYEQIYECLSPAEIKKVEFAKKQCAIKRLK